MNELLLNTDETLTKYLFDELSETEEKELQDRLLMDDELYERMEVVEMNLIDSFIRNEMITAERERFQKRFLIYPLNRDKVREAQLFHESLTRLHNKKAPPEIPRSNWGLFSFLSKPSGLALSSLILIVSIGVFVIAVRSINDWNLAVNITVPTTGDLKQPRDQGGQVSPEHPASTPTPSLTPLPKPNTTPPVKASAFRDGMSKRSLVPQYQEISVAYSKHNMGGGSPKVAIRNPRNARAFRFVFPITGKAEKYFVTIERENGSDTIASHQKAIRHSRSKAYVEVPAEHFRVGETYTLTWDNLKISRSLVVKDNNRYQN